MTPGPLNIESETRPGDPSLYVRVMDHDGAPGPWYEVPAPSASEMENMRLEQTGALGHIRFRNKGREYEIALIIVSPSIKFGQARPRVGPMNRSWRR